MEQEPKTLQQSVIYFADPTNCRNYLVARRWSNGVICPRCGGANVIFQAKYNRWQCGARHDSRQFTAKTGTIMEDSPLGLDKWLMAMWLIVNCKNGISSYEVHRAIGVTQKSAWFMDHRIRMALHNGSFENLLSGKVEADETFIGGKARNMHANVKARKVTGTGGKDKTMVMGILERGGKVRTKVIDSRKKRKRFRLKSASMWKRVPRSIPMRSSPTTVWMNFSIRLLTMPFNTWMATCIRMVWRISGAYSSAA
jgi:ISXO2-like transposase domain/Transposase zinc-ribbon domain